MVAVMLSLCLGCGALLCLPCGLFLLDVAYDHRAGRIANDVERCTPHVKQSVYAKDEADTRDGQTHAFKYHRKHYHPRAGHTRRADGCQRCGEDDHRHLPEGEVDAVAGCDEHGADTHIDGCAVHVDGRPEREDKAGDAFIRAEPIRAFLRNG